MYRISVIGLTVLLLGGCAGSATRSGPSVPVEDQSTSADSRQRDINSTSEGIADPDTSSPPSTDESDSGQAEMNPVIVALLDSAEQELQSGREENAVAVIERALNLEPKNASLWSSLAVIRLQQGIWQQAYVMANKSNSLAQGNRLLQIRNWQIIEKARAGLGDTNGSAQARDRVKKLQMER
ncbi:MAG: hypothetical protein WD355_04655 [Balneolaceae bacterium]